LHGKQITRKGNNEPCRSKFKYPATLKRMISDHALEEQEMNREEVVSIRGRKELGVKKVLSCPKDGTHGNNRITTDVIVLYDDIYTTLQL